MNINDVYGWWTVIGIFKVSGRKAALCRCACGLEQMNLQSNLINGNTTKCRSCSYKNRGPLVSKRITGTHLAEMDKFSDYKKKARDRELTFSLEYDYFLSLIKQLCHYCHSEPTNVHKIYNKDWAEPLIYNGIDRISNELGYEPGNVVACCWRCNYMKRDLSMDEFLNHVKTIAYYASEQLTRR